MKRRRRDPDFAARQAAAASERMQRQHADQEFEAKRIAEIVPRKRNGTIDPSQPALLILTAEGSSRCGIRVGTLDQVGAGGVL